MALPHTPVARLAARPPPQGDAAIAKVTDMPVPLNRSRRSPVTHSKRCIAFWSAILRERVGSPSKRSSISRTLREQDLQTNCKPAPERRRPQKEKTKRSNQMDGAPGRMGTLHAEK